MKTLSLFSSRVSALLITLSLLTSSLTPFDAAAANSCGTCDMNAETVKGLVTDATCKGDASCMSCVVNNAAGDTQSQSYCAAYKSSNKGQTLQTITASMNLASAAVCGT